MVNLGFFVLSKHQYVGCDIKPKPRVSSNSTITGGSLWKVPTADSWEVSLYLSEQPVVARTRCRRRAIPVDQPVLAPCISIAEKVHPRIPAVGRESVPELWRLLYSWERKC